ncbi:ligand-binding sensor domain-containing protein [Desulfofalx alkaliphila]|uniref:ligand-binding sensor domain-containing protein n=1 Tax=Desulfofalx alkaliphila TaxID=105483 RepID=UPI0005563687|nr:two-component regulator propeller domain-containing protein [Desulfofalx alkaliphila]
MKKNKLFKKLSIFVLIGFLLSTLIGFVPQQTKEALAAAPDLIITGTGLEQDVMIYASDWDNYQMVERIYSSNNSFGTHRIQKVRGYDLFELIGVGNLKTDQDYLVKFIASDNFSSTRSVSNLLDLYTYPDFGIDSEQSVMPTLGFYSVELFTSSQDSLSPPVTYADLELSTDNGAPRLYLGQQKGNIHDQNHSDFVSNVVRIVVGEERPADDPPPGDNDFADSPYKHISYSGAPYNIDAITGATFTVEGPGVTSYRALSLVQIEETNAGLYRDTYTERIGDQVLENSYEGIKVSYILDNFVKLRSDIGNIVFKDYQRKTIAEYTLEQVRDEARKMIVAYGVNEVPLVYTDYAGYIPEKYNDGGCFKLVYHGDAGDPPTFSNVAYIYVEETERPGYEHTDNPPYDDPKFMQYVFTLSGSGLGKEVNYTVADLEAMTELHVEKEYSLSNSYYYWYYNTYKGVPLWDLLIKSGLDPDIDESTPVHFIAADHYNIPPMTVREIKNHHLWGYYEKDPTDLGDGSFDGRGVEPLETGYPVLVSYGYNGYPYVNHASDSGYNSGLNNDGGPLRIVFGKLDYDYTNGANQVKFAMRVVVGEDIPYTTHSYQPYKALGNDSLTVTVIGDDGGTIKQETLTVSDIENMIYGPEVPAATAERARVKGYYYTHDAGGSGGAKISDLYEGVSLNYLLFEKIGLPGTTGTVTFTSSADGQAPLTVNLADITREDYFNEVTGATWLKPMLAFGKNGYPMVKSKGDPGYEDNPIVNRYGPLMALFGQTEKGTPGQWLRTIDSITVNISKDSYAHLEPPYDQYQSDTLSIGGSGVRKDHTVTLGELEFMQNYIFTGEYCLASDTEKELASYRGIDIYEFIRREVGFTGGADTVTFKTADGSSKTFSLDEIAKRDYINEETGANDLKVMLAYGKNERPLVSSDTSDGYDHVARNSGGPLLLVIGQTETGDLNSAKSVSGVVEIIVTATDGDSWKHDYGVYTQYLDQPVLRVTGSQVKEPRTFSLRQLEALDQHIVRDLYMGETEVEGVVLWKLIKDVVGLADGVTVPSSIRVFDGPSYNQLQNVSQVMNGVVNSRGETKDIIIGYAVNGYPLVPHSNSPGYVNNNEFGPLRLFVEENNSMWTKWMDCVVVGAGDYEEPRAEDIIDDPADPMDPVAPPELDWTIYRNDDGSGLPWANVLRATPDGQGGVWVGTSGGGAAYRDAAGQWTVYDQSNSPLPHNMVNDIAVDSNGGVWFATGSSQSPGGIAYKMGEDWTVYTTQNSGLSSDYILEITPDKDGGIWFGTGAGPIYLDADGNWNPYENENLPGKATTVIELDEEGGIWFGFHPLGQDVGIPGGYAYLDVEGNLTPYEFTEDGRWVRSISFDRDGGIWICRFGKVDYIAPDGQKNVYQTDKDLLPYIQEDDIITYIEADSLGGLWLATMQGGLFYRSEDGEFSVYNNTNTWPTSGFNYVWRLKACEDGHIWVSTNGGLAVTNLFEAAEHDKPVFTMSPVDDGAYSVGTTADGISTMTVNPGVYGFNYFTVDITPITSHEGKESVVFTHYRNGSQLGINATRADFDVVKRAQAGFNVQPGDVIKAYIVDELINAADVNPVILQ